MLNFFLMYPYFHREYYLFGQNSEVDDSTYFLSVGLDDFGRLYLKERPISLPMVPISDISTKYGI